MTDQEKAERLLATATRVMCFRDLNLCSQVFNGHDGGKEFTWLCERLEIYLR